VAQRALRRVRRQVAFSPKRDLPQSGAVASGLADLGHPGYLPSRGAPRSHPGADAQRQSGPPRPEPPARPSSKIRRRMPRDCQTVSGWDWRNGRSNWI